jgi:protein gp37
MNNTPECEFIVQTKNSTRMVELSKKIVWTNNIWMGVTVTSKKNLDRIDHLRNTGAKIKWVAFHPLKNEIPKIELMGIDWVVVGPANGANKNANYDRRKLIIIDECKRLSIPYCERDRSYYRRFKEYSKNKFPKDLDALEVI